MGKAGLVSVNGVVSPPDRALIPALDRGFLFSDAVFESFVAFGPKILGLKRHLDRLRVSAEAMSLEIPWTDAELEFELQNLVELVPVPKKAVRLVVTRGLGMGLKTTASMTANKIVYCLPASVEPRETYEEGISLKRMIKDGATRGAAAKTTNYMGSVLAVQRAGQEGFQDVLWTNGEGELSESTIANIFLIARQGDLVEIVTPPAMSGILLGITRETIIKLLASAKIPVHEQVVFADELPRFDEAFLCSTVRGLVPIRAIDRQKLFSARPTAVFRHIERLYNTWVETELGHRVDWSTGDAVARQKPQP